MAKCGDGDGRLRGNGRRLLHVDGGCCVARFATSPTPLRRSVLNEKLSAARVRILERIDGPCGEGAQ